MTNMNPTACPVCTEPVPAIGTFPGATRLYFLTVNGEHTRLCGQACYLASRAAVEADDKAKRHAAGIVEPMQAVDPSVDAAVDEAMRHSAL
jgi:hypothetical protein